MARRKNYQFTNSFPYLLNRVGVRIAALFDERIAMYGVNMPMYRVLAALREKPDQRLGDLSAMTTIELSTLSRLIGTMKRKGLVSRKRPEDNGRTVAINLTPKGRGLVDELIPIVVHFEEVAVRTRTASEVQWLNRVLAEAYDCLNDLDAEIRGQGAAPRRAAE